MRPKHIETGTSTITIPKPTGTGTSTISPTKPPGPPPKPQGGAIAGGTAAGVVVVALGILGAVMFRKRQRSKSEHPQGPAELPTEGTYIKHGAEGSHIPEGKEGEGVQ